MSLKPLCLLMVLYLPVFGQTRPLDKTLEKIYQAASKQEALLDKTFLGCRGLNSRTSVPKLSPVF
jgi:hypothetical protein